MICGSTTEKAYERRNKFKSIGLGFLDDADTHFDKRGQFARLAQAIASQPGAIGD